MNKALYLAIGSVLGAAAGSITTYFVVKGRFEAERDEAIEEYAEHAESRIEAIKERYEDNVVGDLDSEEEKIDPDQDEDADERKINNNEGVKKYHHYDGQELPEYASKRVFTKSTKEEEMAKKEVNYIQELKEIDYLDSDMEKQTIDVLFRYEGDAVEELWGYQTDNQTTCQAKFGKGLIDLIGIDGEDMLDWVEPDEGTAVRYFRNSELGIDFEIVIHCDPETYYNKEES